MKKIIFALILCCSLACNKEEQCIEVTYGTAITLETETLLCIGGEEYTFVAVDERCCCGCVCIWEGQFLLNFNNADGSTAYQFEQVMIDENEVPPFGTSLEVTGISGEGDCGGENNINDISFTIIINE